MDILKFKTIFQFLLACMLKKSCSSLELDVFTAASNLSKLTIDYDQNFLYVGGVDVLIRLNARLEKQDAIAVGPVFDSDNCFVTPTPCTNSRSHVSNTIKILLINSVHSYLVACGTVGQGLCKMYSPTDFSTAYNFNATYHASFVGSKASSVAFFGRPPRGVNTTHRMLYSAVATYDRTKEMFSPMTISTRKIVYNDTHSSLDYLIDNPGLAEYSYLSVQPSMQSRFRVKYIYGFEHNGYGYYISIQPNDPDVSRTSYSTRLIQFCLDDRYYKTYIETVIQCKHEDMYTLATAAYMQYGGTSDYLAVSFGRSSKPSSSEPDPQYGSVICNFSMTVARLHFFSLQKNCYNGGTGHYPWWVYGSMQKCTFSPTLFKDDSYCAYDRSQKIGISGDELDPLSILYEEAIVCIDDIITSIVLTDQLAHPIAVVGTASGQLIKVGMQASTKAGFCAGNKPYMKYQLSDKPILQDMVMDAKQEYLYAMSGNKIFRFPIQSCEVYESCSKCVSSKDPQGCGWCGGRCSKKDECVDPNVIWSHDTCAPVITSFEPVSGPTGGGTLLSIKGDNFGYKIPQVRIGDSVEQCTIQTEALSNTQIICKTHTSDLEGTFSVEVKISDLSMEKLNYKVDGTFKTSDLKFEYRTPKLTSVFPLYGPRSGGTLVTLTGDNFHVGLNLSVSIGNLPCDIKSVNKTTILVLTTPAPRLLGSGRKRAVRKDFVILTIDGQTLYSADNYEYREDATVTSITPSNTIYSGGTRVTVVGTNLDAVQRPKIGVFLSSSEQTAEDDNCTTDKADGGKKMVCVMPQILPLMTSLDQSQLMHVSVYFVMDGIERLRNLKDYDSSLSGFIYNPNPSLHKFEESEYLRIFDIADDYLEIKGEALTRGLNKESYHVNIGRNTCNVTFVGERQLHCVPERPKTVSDNEPKQAVVVHIGRYLHFDIGYLKFTMTIVPTKSSVNIGVIVVVVLLVLIVVAIIILCIIMKKRKMGLFRDKNAAQLRYIGEDQRLMEQNRQNNYLDHGAGTPPASPIASAIDEETRLFLQDQKLLIDRQYLEMGELLGAGHFGSVFKGYLTFPDVKGDTLVAVKTLHQNSPRQIDVQAFLKEALIMKDFNHPHVLNLIGICLGMDDMPLVVLPYMKHGDLLSYIRDEHNSPTIKDLITFGIGIAQGMAYLSELKFVHRDLACRNCMLDENYQCKVADFGLSRDIYEKDYYASESKKTMLPVKWMALECLEKGKYSTKSDVWSYGIVLWELMTRGVNPYPEVDNWDIVRFLKHGRRMPQPQYCPDLLYAIMRKCWHPNPKERPTFSQLVHEVTDMITMMEQAMKQGQHTADIQTTYVNMENCTDYHYTDELMPAGSITYDDDSSAPTSPTSPGGPNSPVVQGTKSPVSQGATGTSEDLPAATSSNHDTKSKAHADISHPDQDTKGKHPAPKPKPKTPKKPTTAKIGTPPTVTAGKKENTEKSETREKDDEVFTEHLVSSNGKTNEEESIA